MIGLIRYAPGARSAWHSHARGQFLHITQGVALCGSRDGTVYEVDPGETYYCQPGEEHWHAAESDCFMELLGVMEDADDPDTTTNWLEHVTDDEYNAPRLRR